VARCFAKAVSTAARHSSPARAGAAARLGNTAAETAQKNIESDAFDLFTRMVVFYPFLPSGVFF
jgi:hypothetical protein